MSDKSDRPGFLIADQLGFGVADREAHQLAPEDVANGLAEVEALRTPEAIRKRAPLHEDMLPQAMADLAEVLKRSDHGLAPDLLESIRRNGRLRFRHQERVVYRRMPLNECRGNVQRLLKVNPLWHFAVGFAWLRETEMWVRHSWALNDEHKLVETTAPFDIYFGVALEAESWAEYYARKKDEK